MRTKDRNLSPIDYIKVLEVEWWICNLRRKIYPSITDKNFYNRVANLKRDRIKSMSERNEIESIFTDKEKMRALNKKFMKEGGIPIFEGMTESDLINYYSPNNDVRCFLGFGEDHKEIVMIGKILNFDKISRKVEVIFDKNETKIFEITKVSRIF